MNSPSGASSGSMALFSPLSPATYSREAEPVGRLGISPALWLASPRHTCACGTADGAAWKVCDGASGFFGLFFFFFFNFVSRHPWMMLVHYMDDSRGRLGLTLSELESVSKQEG